MRRRIPLLRICALTLTVLLGLRIFIPATPRAVPLKDTAPRQLLRIWNVSSIGGSDAWLKKQLQRFEKQHPGVMTYLRTVTPADLTDPDAVLPDLMLYTPGMLTDPQALFLPLEGAASLLEPLLACGQMQGVQYGLPLCWGAYVLCIDSRVDAEPAHTPAPTTLLGRAAPTPEVAATPLPYPYEALLAEDMPLLSPSGCGTLALCSLLASDRRPALPPDVLSPADVYARFRARQCASAMLTTGQVTALSALTAAGKGVPFRTMVPDVIITDQVLLGSIVRGSEDSAAAALLAFLTGTSAQQALSAQSLHTVRHDLSLYPSGVEAQVTSAARRALIPLNAYHSPADAAATAHRVYTGQADLSSALAPLR